MALAIPEDGLRLGERSPAHHAARQGAERAGGEHIGAALPFIEGGRIRPIGVTSLTRVSALPDVPAIAEHPPLAGFELVNFFGFYGPAGLPDPILRRLNAAAVQTLRLPEVATKLKNMGFEPAPSTPEQYREFIKNESAKFAKIIVEAGVKLEQ